VDPSYASFRLPDDRELEQQIATEATARDPVKALQLARDSLAKGLSFQLLSLLDRLNQNNGKTATIFAGDIIDKLRGRNLATDSYGAHIAVYMINFSRTPREAPGAKLRQETRPLKLEPEQRRELLDMVTNAALTESANPNLLFAIDYVMPEIQEFLPERVALLQKKLAAFNQTLNKEQKVAKEYDSIFSNGTPEDMLKLAGRAGDDQRESMQQQAIIMAVMRGRADSLRELVNTEIEDQSRRKNLLDALDAEEISLAANKGDADGLRKLLPKIRLKEARARAMAEIAVVLEKKGNHDEALKLLDEAQTLIKTDLGSDTQTDALLALVTAYALVEPAKAFGIIERTIDRANDEIAKALLLDKIVSSGAIKKGEIRLQQSGMIPLDFAVFKYGKSVATLANVDFDRTKAAADRFERNELRLMVRLMLAQALLRSDNNQSLNEQ
jgi:tetratricopeptide (TPR) repeat protein